MHLGSFMKMLTSRQKVLNLLGKKIDFLEADSEYLHTSIYM